jgi:TPR repeat protein
MKSLAIIGVVLTLSCNTFADELEAVGNAMRIGNIPLAVRLAKPIADKGDADAQSLVGASLFSGADGVIRDAKEGVHYLTMCANNPKSERSTKGDCLWLLASAAVSGDGMKKDAHLAVKFMWKSARLGNESATRQLIESVCKNGDANCPNVLLNRIAQCKEPCLQ